MTMLGPHSRFAEVLAVPQARKILERAWPDVEASVDALAHSPNLPISIALMLGGIPRAQRDACCAELAGIPRPEMDHGDSIAPDPSYEGPEVAVGSAELAVPEKGKVNVPLEIEITGPSHGNPFVDVNLWAEFKSEQGKTVPVGGFYDGDGTYLIRFLPPEAGLWTFSVRSTARSMEGLDGAFHAEASDVRGPVRVDGEHMFAYANGRPYVPVGTTAYAWTHQPDDLQDLTLETLESSPFNKVRMGVFPKHFDYNRNEPVSFPFVREDGQFDLTRFDPEHFRSLEQRLRQLDSLGVQADLILFHPYDRWGFADLGPAVDERYLTYLVRRLASFPNVWWSMANEYDFVWSKDLTDWDRLAEVVRREDHVGHLLSIHNGIYLFDYSADWATHCSIQRTEAVQTTEMAWSLRERWGKPVVFDEMGYEGDLEYDWGNVPPVEVVRQFWEATIGGGYVTHGETYWNPEEELFWSKGGRLIGESPARIAFLARIVGESPTGRLEPLTTGIRGKSAGVAGSYEIRYLGLAQPREITLTIPAGRRAHIDILDTWEMTIDTLPGLHECSIRVPLPVKPYMAVRMRAEDPKDCS